MRHTSRRLPTIAAIATLAVAGAAMAQQATEPVDQAIPRYAPAAPATGNVRIAGTSAATGLLSRVGDAFLQSGAKVKMQSSGGDAASAIAALADGSADLVALNRPMTADERGRVQAKAGAVPTEIVAGLDAVAIYVHRDNPVKSLSVADVARLFGTGSASAATAKTWGELPAAVGVDAALKDQPVVTFGVRPDAGSSSLLRERALGGGGFRSDMQVQRVPTVVVSGVGANKGAIGYASPAFRSSQGTRIVPVDGVEPTARTLLDGSYPLGGKVYVYVVRKDGLPNAAALEFLRFVLSRDGQEAAAKEGNSPLPSGVVSAERAKVG
ncbi:MAG: substrate-binding domain-containing protein [Phycisphaerae bacterium]|nr:substrate-binding domain-containing protein [Phycisphaerae bacterium]